MKKYLFLIVVTLATLQVTAQKKIQTGVTVTGYTTIRKQTEETHKVLYIIDGVAKTKEAWDSIPKEKLKRLNIYKNVQQVYVVQTQAPENQVRVVNYREVTAKPTNNPIYLGTLASVPDSAIKGPDAFIVRKTQTGVTVTGYTTIRKQTEETHKVLYIIDGVAKTKEAWDSIPKEKLKRLNIYKNVLQVYVVQTQAPENQVHVINYREVTAKPTNNPKYLGTLTSVPDSAIKIFGPDAFIVRKNNPTPPLWLVKKGEDKYQVIKEKEVQAMDRELIKGMMILKDRTAEPYKKYGDTSNGVVILVLRESKKK